MAKKLMLLFLAVVVLSLVAACGAVQPETITVVETVVVEKEVEGEPVTVVETVEVVKEVKEVEVEAADPDADRVTLRTIIGNEPPSLDPSLATDTTSVFFISNMFVGLTKFDQEANVIPSLADRCRGSKSRDG